MAKNLFQATAAQKILDFLSKNPYRSFYSAEIALRTLLSKGGTNQTLRKMAKGGLLKSEKKGRMIFYSIDSKSPVVRQFKVLGNFVIFDYITPKIKTFF